MTACLNLADALAAGRINRFDVISLGEQPDGATFMVRCFDTTGRVGHAYSGRTVAEALARADADFSPTGVEA